jgi:hypothetical protein
MFDRLLGQIFNIFRGSPRDPEPRDKVGDDAIMIVGDARPMDNLNTPSQATGSKPELEGLLHPDRKELFHWLLLLLRLVTTIRFGFPVWKFEPKEANSVGRFHTQSYGYLDALTTLLLRRDEIVAAVEISPGSGFIMSDDKSKDAEVRWHFYLYHLAQLIHISVRRFNFGGFRLLRYNALFTSWPTGNMHR